MQNIEHDPLAELIAGILASPDPELGITAAEADVLMQRIETEHATDCDLDDPELVDALRAHDLIGTRRIHGRAW